jgi:hypothetical protein
VKPSITLRQSLSDPHLLGHALPPTAQPLKVLLIAAMGEQLTADERVIFRQFTGRDREPGQLCKNIWWRRSPVVRSRSTPST